MINLKNYYQNNGSLDKIHTIDTKIDDIKKEDRIVIMISKNTKTKGLLIGRQAKNLRNLEKVVNRYFEVEEIKVE